VASLTCILQVFFLLYIVVNKFIGELFY
jgi:hypothetical protein